jgi:ribosomal protein S18 acetylase RimI-like enzyme
MASTEIEYRSTAGNLSPKQLRGFFVGWPSPPSPETHLKLLEQSDLIELGIDTKSGQVVGFLTAITDGVLAAYLPLLEVLPEYQHRGIGSELVRRIVERLSRLYMIDLFCDPELEPFYSRFGLVRGGGMMRRNYAAQSGAVASKN